jgi:netrin-G3 ligand
LLANISLWQNQYAFIHDAILEALLCGDTQISAFDLQRVVERLTQTEEENGGKTGFEQQFEVNYNFLVQKL